MQKPSPRPGVSTPKKSAIPRPLPRPPRKLDTIALRTLQGSRVGR